MYVLYCYCHLNDKSQYNSRHGLHKRPSPKYLLIQFHSINFYVCNFNFARIYQLLTNCCNARLKYDMTSETAVH